MSLFPKKGQPVHGLRGLITVGALVGVTSLVCGGVATADPARGVVPNPTDTVGVGSDTTEALFDRLAIDYDNQDSSSEGDNPPGLYSFRATGSATITTKRGCSAVARPDGSSPGIDLLEHQQILPSGQRCVDFARSIEGPLPGDPANLAFVPIALDGLDWAANADGNAPQSITMNDLKAILECTATKWNQVGGTSTDTIQPFLPVGGPGLSAFLQNLAGISQVGPCVTMGMQQDQGIDPALRDNPNAVVFYSIGKYLGQTEYDRSDVHGSLVLGQINGLSPTIYNPTTGRIEFNVGQVSGIQPFPSTFQILEWVTILRNPDGTIPAHVAALFAGSSSWICANSQAKIDIQNYGFLLAPPSLCGQVR